MAEQIFIIEDGTLTKFECDDYVEVVCVPDCVKNIGYRELQFLPYWRIMMENQKDMQQCNDNRSRCVFGLHSGGDRDTGQRHDH